MQKDRSDFLVAAVEKNRKLIFDAYEYIWANPETGFKENKTSAYLADKFRHLGYELTEAGDIPGFVAYYDTGRPGPTVCVFGELDALNCPTHPAADPETGAVHACGHCCQASALLGVAAAVKEEGVTDLMCGKIMFCAVPAEELIEVGYREELYNKGIIKYFGGKPEFLRRGLLDDAQICILIHTGAKPANVVCASKGANGCIAKIWTFKGKSSHAAHPDRGINALYAVNTALTACNAIRETFNEKDCLRFHPTVTKSSSAVNVIPDHIEVESYVRGASMDAIVKTNEKVNRAAAAAAASIGAQVHIKDRPGYYVVNNDAMMVDVIRESCDNGVCTFDETPFWSTGCTDIGDISSIMPIVHPNIGGAAGAAHGDTYRIDSFDSTCVSSAKVQLKALEILLCDNAQRANAIIANYKPAFASKEEYFGFMDKLTFEKDAVNYNEDGSVSLSYKK